MARVHAFGDDHLQDLDAVGLVEAYRDGLSVVDVVEAAIARAHAVDDQLGALAYEAFDRARAEARSPHPGYFSGVPTFLKDNVDVAGMPTQNGTDAYVARPAAADGDFARMYLATGLLPLGKTRLSEFGFSGAVDHPRLGPVRTPVEPRALRRRLVGRRRRLRRHRRGPDRARQRRRRLDPDPGLGQRAGRPQAHPRPARPGQVHAADAGPDRLRRRAHPLGARHRGVLPRGREGLPRPPAGPGRRHHPARPRSPQGRRRHPRHRARREPRGGRADPADRGAARVPGPPGRGDRPARCRPSSPTTSSSTGRCWR